jgi:hypothetical protein
MPRTVAELIIELAARYPETRPAPDQSRDQIMFDSGARSVVLLLQAWQAQTVQKERHPEVSF